MTSKLNILGLSLNSLFPILALGFVLTYKTEVDLFMLSQDYITFDILIGFIIILGVIVGPVLIIINYLKSKRNILLPFILSISFSVLSTLIFACGFKIFGIRIFLSSIIYLGFYSFFVFIKLRRKKS